MEAPECAEVIFGGLRSTRRVEPSEALVNVDGHLSKAAADQLRTIDKRRLRGHIGRLTEVEMRAVEQAVRVQLDL